MGYGKTDGGRFRYFDAKNGGLFSKDPDTGEVDRFDYVEGCITGVRLWESEYQGQRTESVQFRLSDPDHPETVILSTTLGSDDTLTTSAWMLLARLTNPANGIGPGVPIRISAYGYADNEKVTCIAVRHADEGAEALRGYPAFDKSIETGRAAVTFLIGKYGEFGKKEGDGAGAGPSDEAPAPSAIRSPEVERKESLPFNRPASTTAQPTTAEPQPGAPTFGKDPSDDGLPF